MADRSYEGDDRGISLAWQTPPWVSEGETVAGSTEDDRGEERTVGTPETANTRRSEGVEGRSGGANPGLEADDRGSDREDRRDDLRELVNAVGDPALLDRAALADRYGVDASVISGDLVAIERERWTSPDYSVEIVE